MIKLELEMNDINYLTSALAQKPYMEVKILLDKIIEQTKEQVEKNRSAFIKEAPQK